MTFVLVCIDQIPTAEFIYCSLCDVETYRRRNCRTGKWKYGGDECKGYSEKIPVANLPIKDICKGTCDNCGKYVLIHNN